MSTSLRALLGDSLDYAGFAPPAQLSLEEAFRNYARYVNIDQAWMLGRFVSPAARLPELEAAIGRMPVDFPLRLSMLGGSVPSVAEILASLQEELKLVDSLAAKDGTSACVESYELPVRMAPVEDEDTTRQFLDQFSRQSQDAPLWPKSIFLELFPLAEYSLDSIEAAARWCTTHSNQLCAFGLKVRLGGQVDGIPVPRTLADFIAKCTAEGCVWKATAGLHNPLSAYDNESEKHRFGFLNVFAAGVLSDAYGLTSEAIERVLVETDPAILRFAGTMRWGETEATTEQIESSRRATIQSFGSCSFDEPIAGLRQLNLLEESSDG